MEPIESATEIDYARLAAYIDGEGHIEISCNKTHRYYMLKVTIVNGDFRLPEWCQDHFGGILCRFRYHGDPKNYAPMKRWILSSWQASNVLKRCLPYFICKREEAEKAIQFKQTFGSRGTRITESDRTRREELMLELRNMTKTGPKEQIEKPKKPSPQSNLFAN